MQFKMPLLLAMRERVPKTFNRMSLDGTLMDFVDKRVREAHQLFNKLTKDAPKDGAGTPMQPYRSEAYEVTMEQMLSFTVDHKVRNSLDEFDAFLSERRTDTSLGE